MSSITAALGIAQLSKLDKIISKRRNVANKIITNLAKFSEIITPKPSKKSSHIYQMLTIILPNEERRDHLHKFLLSKKIFSKVYFEPIHKTSFYREKYKSKLPITEQISKQVLTLPVYPNMENEEIDYLTNSIDEFFENNG
jgi:perosamine synthetase